MVAMFPSVHECYFKCKLLGKPVIELKKEARRIRYAARV
jgi:hypothetical protein